MFEHRSGRVIAASRLSIAMLFGLWVWLDPYQPVRGEHGGLALFAGYVLVAAALLAIAWRDWWLDFRLSVPAYALDCAIFLLALYFTQPRDTDLVIPFTTFFVYLVLAPGTYSAINVSCDTVFSPGIYVIDGGRFKITGQNRVTGSAVMFVL